MNLKYIYRALLLVALMGGVTACDEDKPFEEPDPNAGQIGEESKGGNIGNIDVQLFDTIIHSWAGDLRADDYSQDVAGTNNKFYWEANTFTKEKEFNIAFNGDAVSVSPSSPWVMANGANVIVSLTDGMSFIVSGKSDNGSLKFIGDSKFKLTLDNLELTSQTGPAINNQSKKGMFLHLADGTANRLADMQGYDDLANEQRKACLFSEGHILMSGSGLLEVAGRNNHAIATDGYMRVRPGVTLAVTEAANNAIHVKGDVDDNIGFYMGGGLIYAYVDSPGGRAIKTDLHVEVEGGQLLLNTKGGAVYDTEDGDLSSAACIKADGNVTIKSGKHTLKSGGGGGKGINATGTLNIQGGETTVITTGGTSTLNELNLSSSPKAVKVDGNVTIEGGALNVLASAESDGSEGMDCASSLTINDGAVYIYAYDDAVNVTKNLTVNAGKLYAYSVNNDGIDVTENFVADTCLILASSENVGESAIDVAPERGNFTVRGATIIAYGGPLKQMPVSGNSQPSFVYSGLTASQGYNLALLDEEGTPLFTYCLPRAIENMTLLVSEPRLSIGQQYTLSLGGIVTEQSDYWYGWGKGGIWDDGEDLPAFTLSEPVTVIGQ